MGNDNFKKVKIVLLTILLANLLVAALKLMIGTIIKSASLTADGFHSLTDGSSNIVGLIGVQLASKPVDEDHPYGHGKFETLAGLIISGMLTIIGFKVIADGVTRLINPLVPVVTLESICLLIFTLLVNIGVSVYEYNKGKELGSKILIYDSLHTRSDIFVSLGVLTTLICIKFGLPAIIDSLTSLVISVFILKAAYEIFKESSAILVDQAVVDTEKIRDITLSFAKVKDIHKIRSRGSENELHIDMHLVLDPDLNVEECHELIHDIEDKLRKEVNENIQMIAHLEPHLEDSDVKAC